MNAIRLKTLAKSTLPGLFMAAGLVITSLPADAARSSAHRIGQAEQDCKRSGSANRILHACGLAADLRSSRPYVYIKLAETLIKEGQTGEAVVQLSRAAQRLPGNQDITNALANAEKAHRGERYNKNIAAADPSQQQQAQMQTPPPPKPQAVPSARPMNDGADRQYARTTPPPKPSFQGSSYQDQKKAYQPPARQQPQQQATAPRPSSTASSSQRSSSLKDQLALLEELKSDGLISDTEYKERRQALMDAKFGRKTSGNSNKTASANNGNDLEAIVKTIKFGRYQALVIGNNRYKHLTNLETAVGDARSVGSLLQARYGFEVTVIENADRYEILTQFSKLRGELGPNDNLLIYYAGHGYQDPQTGRGYWLPIDAESDNTANWIPNTEITDALKAMAAKHIMVVADSCYSGTLTRAANISLKNQNSGRGEYVKRMAAKRARTVMTSGGVEPVLDSGGDGHSVFASAFLNVLKNTDTVLDGQGLFAAVQRPVIVNSDQTPEYSDIRLAGHEGGDFLFVPRK